MCEKTNGNKNQYTKVSERTNPVVKHRDFFHLNSFHFPAFSRKTNSLQRVRDDYLCSSFVKCDSEWECKSWFSEARRWKKGTVAGNFERREWRTKVRWQGVFFFSHIFFVGQPSCIEKKKKKKKNNSISVVLKLRPTFALTYWAGVLVFGLVKPRGKDQECQA